MNLRKLQESFLWNHLYNLWIIYQIKIPWNGHFKQLYLYCNFFGVRWWSGDRWGSENIKTFGRMCWKWQICISKVLLKNPKNIFRFHFIGSRSFPFLQKFGGSVEFNTFKSIQSTWTSRLLEKHRSYNVFAFGSLEGGARGRGGRSNL